MVGTFVSDLSGGGEVHLLSGRFLNCDDAREQRPGNVRVGEIGNGGISTVVR